MSDGRTTMEKSYAGVVDMLKCHVRYMLFLPGIAIAPLKLTPRQGELVHVSVNSLRECPFCTHLHGELGRMAGLPEVGELMKGSCEKVDGLEAKEELPIRGFARAFARDPKSAGIEKLGESVGEGEASGVVALCWFLHWGSMCGNTITSLFRCEGMNPLAKLLFVIYYIPLFFLVIIFGYALKVFPSGGPKIINAILGVTLAFVAGIWIVPLAVVGAPVALISGL